MAGGTFNKLTGKVRPGVYINFESTQQETVGGSDRGIVAIPLINAAYGPKGEWITLTEDSPDAQRGLLGYSIYDVEENRQMVLLREAFRKANTVLVYVTNEGKKATATSGSITATAKCGGERGNDLAFAIAANPAKGYDVVVTLATETVAEYEALETVEELIAQECPYIDFEGEGDLSEEAGVSLTGGTASATTNEDVTEFLEALEKISFNTLCFPVEDESLQEAAVTKIKYMRDECGKYVQAVMPDISGCDYEGIISVTNSVAIGDIELTHAETCAWVAAATAAAEDTESLTYVAYEGATEIVDPKNHEDAVAAINNGEFFFSISEAGDVVVEYDINTLTTFDAPKDIGYRKNRVIRVFDALGRSIQENFPPNKFNNDSTGWDVMEGIGYSVLKQFEEGGAIKDVDYDNDFVVDRELSNRDETYFDVWIQPIDSAEKLYFTVHTTY